MSAAETVEARLSALEKALASAIDRIATYEAVIAHLSQDLAVIEAKVNHPERTTK